ncbi:hypothetical protein DFH01_26060 [Falsiroseomonas bella]|uniref:Uncharacterized protein n=1 Tax=Falsiroseomonas bella TaxID=2184016 RepID=A0A317F5Q5_9PROT|nr:hypothetical protein [Falsiroseomonas bella]PWS34480.1 hypothetical protein DFH01_26060 [Falsiroseomonas bella]
MPLDFAGPLTAPVDAAELHGVPRHLLARHVLDQLSVELRRAVIAVELSEAGSFVNMGMNFDRVAWRIAWRRPGLPQMSGTIPVHRGEIVA